MNEIDRFFGAGTSAALAAKHEARYIDRSDLEAFANCPHQGQLRLQHPESGETHDELPVTGEIVHAIAEEAVKMCEMNLQEAADFIQQELPKARPDLQPDVLRAGRHLAAEIRRFGGNQILLCEEQISRTLIPESTHAGELIITTAPDLVLATTKADSILVLDYKSGWKERTNAEATDEFQTHTISWILLGKYPHVQTIHFFYINTRKGTRAYAKIERQDEDNLQARILTTARLFEEKCDDAWPSEKKCSICSTIKWCKLAAEICKELDGDPKSYVDNTIVLKELLKRREKVVSEATKNGRILYGSCGHYDDTPKRRTRTVSYKEDKKQEAEEE
jgi:hypothetical protein